eukprot:1089649-Pyramimonas_sp.AAC.1
MRLRLGLPLGRHGAPIVRSPPDAHAGCTHAVDWTTRERGKQGGRWRRVRVQRSRRVEQRAGATGQ